MAAITRINHAQMKGVKPYLGLCAYCSLNLNANMQNRVSGLTTGWPADLFGLGQLTLPSGLTFIDWRPGLSIPPGKYLSELAYTFGPEILFNDASGRPIQVYATTIRNGNLVCDDCNAAVLNGWIKS